ncbi:MAG: HAD family hydrolase [Ruminococcus sp.]|nr:HAD family hydrolase [Ruminococcus sp.]
MKTLYISDLDGTLLNSEQRTSEFTNKAINELTDKGMMFTYATARSYSTASKVTKGLFIELPVIVYNGTFIVNGTNGQILQSHSFSRNQAVTILSELIEGGIFPIVYSIIEGKECFSYLPRLMSREQNSFIKTRRGDRRERKVDDIQALFDGEIFYFTCIDKAVRLGSYYDKYKSSQHCIYQSDIYTGEQWLEIMPEGATKGKAVKELAEMTGCDEIVAFGDSINDYEMMDTADKAYSPENADMRIKHICDGIIGSNNDDGVAKFLLEHFK